MLWPIRQHAAAEAHLSRTMLPVVIVTGQILLLQTARWSRVSVGLERSDGMDVERFIAAVHSVAV